MANSKIEKKKAKALVNLAEVVAKKLPKKAEVVAINVTKLATDVAEVLLVHQEKIKQQVTEETTVILGDLIDVKINGKLISIKQIQGEQGDTLQEIKGHLTSQDAILKELNDKVTPIDKTRAWFWGLGRGVIYIGILAGAITGIIVLLTTLKILNL